MAIGANGVYLYGICNEDCTKPRPLAPVSLKVALDTVKFIRPAQKRTMKIIEYNLLLLQFVPEIPENQLDFYSEEAPHGKKVIKSYVESRSISACLWRLFHHWVGFCRMCLI